MLNWTGDKTFVFGDITFTLDITPGNNRRASEKNNFTLVKTRSYLKDYLNLGDKEFEKIPTGAIGLYTYYERLAQGLRQLMCGSRKFSLDYMTRDDLAALTPEAAKISGIQYVMDLDTEEVDEILKH